MTSAAGTARSGPMILPGAHDFNVGTLGYTEVGGNMIGPTINIYAPPQPSVSGNSLFEDIQGWLGPLLFRQTESSSGLSKTPKTETVPENVTQARDASDVTLVAPEPENPPEASGSEDDVTKSLIGDSEPSPSETPTMAQIYVYKMLRSGRGLACWKPDCTADADGLGEGTGVQPGDVGIYDTEEGFEKLFNIWDDEQDINATAMTYDCEQAKYVAPYKRIVTKREFSQGDTVAWGATAEAEDASVGRTVDRFDFTCQDEQGAVLALTSRALLEKLSDKAALADNICANAELLYTHADNRRRIGSEESLYIITGCIKSCSWGLAAFQDRMVPPNNNLRLVKRRPAPGDEHQATSQLDSYLWTHRGTSEARFGSTETPASQPDQCLFLQGFKLNFSSAFRDRMFIRNLVKSKGSGRSSGGGTKSLDSDHPRNPETEDDADRSSERQGVDRDASSTGINHCAGAPSDSIQQMEAELNSLFHPDPLELSEHTSPSSRHALTARALELAREAVQLDSTLNTGNPEAALQAYARSVTLLYEVMEQVRRGEDSAKGRRRRPSSTLSLLDRKRQLEAELAALNAAAGADTSSIPMPSASPPLLRGSPDSTLRGRERTTSGRFEEVEVPSDVEGYDVEPEGVGYSRPGQQQRKGSGWTVAPREDELQRLQNIHDVYMDRIRILSTIHGVQMTAFPGSLRQDTCHPCDIITAHLLNLEQSKGFRTHFALSHDDDWCSLIRPASPVEAGSLAADSETDPVTSHIPVEEEAIDEIPVRRFPTISYCRGVVHLLPPGRNDSEEALPNLGTSVQSEPGISQSKQAKNNRWRAFKVSENESEPEGLVPAQILGRSKWKSSFGSAANSQESLPSRTGHSSIRSLPSLTYSSSDTSGYSDISSLSSTSSSSRLSGRSRNTGLRNVKLISGVPWELDQLPQQRKYANAPGDKPPSRKKGPKEGNPSLSTIVEPSSSSKSPETVQWDTGTENSHYLDLSDEQGRDGAEGSVPRKVHKGQIQALSKMLAALRK
ncbi:hypothetical protein D9611_008154 [Ephemerocybe angulata]|uniref:Uncharacterized protein n=1 Tax=Ephemerocybe angulata TaxID=980116 RepID=A0A8H5BYZ9_9AGAR|nr:hypothetical protein D9611_008154 [Tulosesus angulatus]